MDERGVNIDIVFRNGLKDYEVLPPPEIWDKIGPVIRKKQQPYIIFRAAALIAVALSLSFLAYRWSREILPGQDEQIQAQNTEFAVEPSADAVSLPGRDNRSTTPLLSDASLPAYKPDIINNPVNDVIIQSVDNPSVSDAMPSGEGSSSMKSPLQVRSTPGISSLKPDIGDLPLIQENIEQEKPGRWSIMAIASPSYYNRISKGNNETLAQMMASEKPVLSYSGGVALSYRVNRRFSIQSGVYYSSVGQELSGISSYSGFQKINNSKGAKNFFVQTANGTVYTSNPDVFLTDNYKGERILTSISNEFIDPEKAQLDYIDNSLRQNFNYLELPIVIRYKVVDKTLDFNIVGGVSSNLLVGNSVSAGIGGRSKIGETDGLNSITFCSSLGMGMEYNLSNKLSLNLEPTFRYYLNSFGSIPGMNIHPVSFGVFSGLSYKF
jgi:hypothetical protein